MNIQDLNKKNAERAQALAKELGVEFNVPDFNSVETRTKQRLANLATYHKNPELYDDAIAELLKLVSASELLEIIEKLQSTKN